ncbi:alpha/beta fold hydrolase [Streptomyces reniochalinae]|uniref:Alpha/beta hydrolase n=1 Tax=Streptomyces reniochalinae TaxID=2250578 RepID=A0A367EM88_9ACTN|nr:alpha/beta hydrolase [Streptomyces reniochalinae]RCG19228.1 alpha/beta hydrolase [Streptomyces reniochalinae]
MGEDGGAWSAVRVADATGAVAAARQAWRTAEAAASGAGTHPGAPPVPRAAGGTGRTSRAGLAGAALGIVAAGVALERLTVHRAVRRRARLALDATAPYGSLRGTPGSVRAEDGTELYYETDEPRDGPQDPPPEPPLDLTSASAQVLSPAPSRGPAGAVDGDSGDGDGDGAGLGAGGDGPPVTVVFSHGYCLGQDVWHFQRAALRGKVRCVYWDQRSHGRSARAPVGEPVSIDLLGRDLKAVLDAAAPEGPLVLVGHSMGGMTLMALAEQYPRYVAERVAGVALLGTSAGGLAEVTYGLPAAGARALRRVVPGVLRALAARSELVERGRRASADVFGGLVKRYSFGSPREVDPGVARFAERLIESVPVDVVADFYPAFTEHEKTAALAAFGTAAGPQALVMAGDRDLMTPSEHSARIAAALPRAAFVLLEATGHLLMLERPEEVNGHLARLLARTIRTHGSTARPASRPGRADRGGRPPRP